MKIFLKLTPILLAFLGMTISLKAQLPDCAGADSNLLFVHGGPGIQAYDPSLPLSPTNPYTYVVGGGGGGLTISTNLNGGTPSPAFYSNVGGMYSYYNGVSAWISTGHTVPVVNPGGGPNFIFSINGGTGEIWKYDGTGNATFLTTTYPNSGPYDLVVDAQNNFYHMYAATSPGKIHKYSPAGVLIDSFVVNGNPVQTAGGGFAMIGNVVYAVFNSSPSFYSGPIINGVCNLTPIGNMSASDLATCPTSIPNITSNPIPIANFTVSDDTICAGTCVTFTDMSINSPTQWTWSFPSGSPTSSILQNPGIVCFNTPGDYTIQLIATNAVGSDTATRTIHVDYLAPITFDGDKDVCIGESTTITANPTAQSYAWNIGDVTQSITVSPITTTSYTVIVGQGACVDTASVIVEVNPQPSVSLVPNLTGCDDRSGSVISTVVSGTSPFGYNWSNGQTGPDALNVGVGTYTVVVTDAKNCSTSSSATVGVYPNPVATATPAYSSINYGDTVQLNATGGKIYYWTLPTYLSAIDIADPKAYPMVDMDYCVVVTDEHDCKDTACVEIDVKYCEDMFIPNAFSPNGDGINDRFLIKGKCVVHYSFNVTNRWGQQIYKSQHDNESWDGSFNGINQDPGTYFYYAEIEFVSGKRIIKKGDIMLIR